MAQFQYQFSKIEFQCAKFEIREAKTKMARVSSPCTDPPAPPAAFPPLIRWLSLNGATTSRKHAAKLIREGRVKVNDEICQLPATPVSSVADRVIVDDQLVDPSAFSSHRHVIVHKPRGYLTSRHDVVPGTGRADPRPSVYSLLDDETAGRHCVAVGRLDVDVTGLLLFSTDGLLNQRLTEPRFGVEKQYGALLWGKEPLGKASIEQLRGGVVLPGKKAARVAGIATNVSAGSDELLASALGYAASRSVVASSSISTEVADVAAGADGADGATGLDDGSSGIAGAAVLPVVGSLTAPEGAPGAVGGAGDPVAATRARRGEPPTAETVVRLVVTGGHYHQVKLMFKVVGRPLVRLHRERFGSLRLGDLPCGSCRELTPAEVVELYAIAKLPPPTIDDGDADESKG